MSLENSIVPSIIITAPEGTRNIELKVTISNPPIANANGPYTGVIEYTAVPITFDGTGSYATDPAGTITSYDWDSDNDGEFDDAVSATPTVSFTAPYSGNISLKVTDNNGATDTSEHIEGTGEFAMDLKKVLDQAANTSDLYDPNFHYKKTMQFQGNATNRLLTREKFESYAIFGGTGTRVNEYFDVFRIRKDESSSIKTISAPGGRQSHSFATMDEFSGIWSTHSQWQKICQKKVEHHQMFMGNFSVQKDLWFEREVVIP